MTEQEQLSTLERIAVALESIAGDLSLIEMRQAKIAGILERLTFSPSGSPQRDALMLRTNAFPE